MPRKPPIQQISDGELYGMLDGKCWEHLAMSEKMEAVQEIERREALRVGRPPVRVELISPKQLPPGTAGAFSIQNGRPRICLNSNYFRHPDFPGYGPAELLVVILHEGRHAYQKFVINSALAGDPLLVPQETFECWFVEDNYYCNKKPLYDIQSIEADARFFALQRLEEIIFRMESEGLSAIEFRIELEREKATERMIISGLADQLPLEKLEDYEMEICQLSDLDEFSYFLGHLYLENTTEDPFMLLEIAREINKRRTRIEPVPDDLAKLEKKVDDLPGDDRERLVKRTRLG